MTVTVDRVATRRGLAARVAALLDTPGVRIRDFDRLDRLITAIEHDVKITKSGMWFESLRDNAPAQPAQPDSPEPMTGEGAGADQPAGDGEKSFLARLLEVMPAGQIDGGGVLYPRHRVVRDVIAHDLNAMITATVRDAALDSLDAELIDTDGGSRWWRCDDRGHVYGYSVRNQQPRCLCGSAMTPHPDHDPTADTAEPEGERVFNVVDELTGRFMFRATSSDLADNARIGELIESVMTPWIDHKRLGLVEVRPYANGVEYFEPPKDTPIAATPATVAWTSRCTPWDGKLCGCGDWRPHSFVRLARFSNAHVERAATRQDLDAWPPVMT